MDSPPEFDRIQLTDRDLLLIVLVFLMGRTDAPSLERVLNVWPRETGIIDTVRATKADLKNLVAGLKRCGILRTADSSDSKLCIRPLSIASQRAIFALPHAQLGKAAIENVLRSGSDPYRFACLRTPAGRDGTPFCLVHEALLAGDVQKADALVPGEDHHIYERDGYAFYLQLAESILREPDAVTPEVVFYLFQNLAETALGRGLPAAPLTAVIAEHVARLNGSAFTPYKFLALCAWATWTASRDLLDLLSAKAGKGLYTEAVTACKASLDGDWPTADKHFARALRLFNAKVSESTAVDVCGNFFLLALLAAIRAYTSKTRVNVLLNKLSSADFYYQSSYARRVGIFPSSLDMLNRIVNQGERPPHQPLPDVLFSLMDGFVCALETLFTEDCAVDDSIRRNCVELLETAHRAGYAFIAASLVPCVRRLQPDSAAAAEACRLVEAAKAPPPLWSEPHVVAAWEHALAELERLAPVPKGGATAADAAAGATHQMVWIVDFRGEDTSDLECYNIGCRLQKRRKNGTWSTGTRIDLNKLCKGEYDAYLDAADQKAKAILIQHRPFYGYQGYYREECLFITALIDHPRVFIPLDPDGYFLDRPELVPTRIERGEPAIDVIAVPGKGTVIRIPWINTQQYDDLFITSERSGLYTVYEKSAKHRQLAEIVLKYGDEGTLRIPAAGAETLKRLVPELSKIVAIKGEFDAESVSARTVQGGVHLHLRAQFVGEAMHFDLKNQPAPDMPFHVTPGHGARKVLTRHEGETIAIVRDLEAERQAFDAFLGACPGLAAWNVSEAQWEVETLPDMLEILGDVHALGDRVSLDWPEGGALSVLRPDASTPFNLRAEAGADFWLEIGGDVVLDNGKVLAFTELLAKIDDRDGVFVQLSDRQYLRLTETLVRQMELLAHAGETDEKSLRIPPSAIALLDGLASGKDAFDFPALVRDRIADFRRVFKTTPQVPPSLTCTLRPYQRDGFVWLAKLTACGLGACLADDMGLGKTVQILALLTARAADGPSMVVAPTSVARNWADEAARFAPALHVAQLAEAEDRSRLVAEAAPFDVIVCSYGLLTFEADLLASREWNVAVLDEAQAVKNHLAKRTKVVKRIRSRARVIATGTPVENNLAELWSLFDFLNPGLLGSTHGQFERRFCNADGTVGPLLKKMTAPFILRRLKSAVLDDLPPKTEITLAVTLDDDERALYESCRRAALAALEGADGENNRIAILAHLTKLRRVCCHPSLVMPGCTMPGQKVEALLELVQDLRANGHRALVFSQFVDFLSIIRKRFDAAGITYQYLDGSTPAAERANAVSRFQRGEGDLFLISLKAGGTGLNLTAANYVVLLDPWWNPAVETQAADRAHRIGQRNPVTVYRLVTNDTVEERVVALHAQKLALAEAILDDTADTRLTADDLIALFKT
jgi:superfamily II DNA or RNA helicase